MAWRPDDVRDSRELLDFGGLAESPTLRGSRPGRYGSSDGAPGSRPPTGPSNGLCDHFQGIGDAARRLVTDRPEARRRRQTRGIPTARSISGENWE